MTERDEASNVVSLFPQTHTRATDPPAPDAQARLLAIPSHPRWAHACGRPTNAADLRRLWHHMREVGPLFPAAPDAALVDGVHAALDAPEWRAALGASYGEEALALANRWAARKVDLTFGRDSLVRLPQEAVDAARTGTLLLLCAQLPPTDADLLCVYEPQARPRPARIPRAALWNTAAAILRGPRWEAQLGKRLGPAGLARIWLASGPLWAACRRSRPEHAHTALVLGAVASGAWLTKIDAIYGVEPRRRLTVWAKAAEAALAAQPDLPPAPDRAAVRVSLVMLGTLLLHPDQVVPGAR